MKRWDFFQIQTNWIQIKFCLKKIVVIKINVAITNQKHITGPFGSFFFLCYFHIRLESAAPNKPKNKRWSWTKVACSPPHPAHINIKQCKTISISIKPCANHWLAKHSTVTASENKITAKSILVSLTPTAVAHNPFPIWQCMDGEAPLPNSHKTSRTDFLFWWLKKNVQFEFESPSTRPKYGCA